MKRKKKSKHKSREKLFEQACKPYIINRKLSKMSYGESIIAEFLLKNNVKFIREHYFTDVFVGGKMKLFFFDFYLPEWNLCIEFDGEQHYTGIWQGKKTNIKGRDFLKTMYCNRKKIHLLRISYKQISKIDKLICEKCDKIKPVI